MPFSALKSLMIGLAFIFATGLNYACACDFMDMAEVSATHQPEHSEGHHSHESHGQSDCAHHKAGNAGDHDCLTCGNTVSVDSEYLSPTVVSSVTSDDEKILTEVVADEPTVLFWSQYALASPRSPPSRHLFTPVFLKTTLRI